MFTAVIQARMGSTRYPRKMEKCKIGGKTLLDHIIHRLRITKSVGKIILAVPQKDLEDFKKYGKHGSRVEVLGGAENSVLNRFIDVCKQANISDDEWILRICGDAPFPEPLYINHLAQSIEKNVNQGTFFKKRFDAAVILGYPLGRQVEAFRLSCLKHALIIAEGKQDWNVLEHIDPLIKYKAIRGDKPLFSVLEIEPLDFSVNTLEDENKLNGIL